MSGLSSPAAHCVPAKPTVRLCSVSSTGIQSTAEYALHYTRQDPTIARQPPRVCSHLLLRPLFRLASVEGKAEKAAAAAAAQLAQMRDLFARYKAFKSSEVADLDARLRAALASPAGVVAQAAAAGGKENDKTAAALLRCRQHDILRRCCSYLFAQPLPWALMTCDAQVVDYHGYCL